MDFDFPDEGLGGLIRQQEEESSNLGLLPNIKFDLDKVRYASNLTLDLNETTINGTEDLEDILLDIKSHINGEWEISGVAFYSLLTLYILVMVSGSFSNGMVLFAIFYRRTMRTAHNSFIATLAVSDFLLCIVTLPVNLWEMLFEKWPFGKHTDYLCSTMMAAQKFPIFLSSLAIVAIGWDRYRCVITPDR